MKKYILAFIFLSAFGFASAQTSDTWIQRANFGGTARYGSTGFSIADKGYMGTGNDGVNRTKDFWEYEPATNTWTQKADFGGEGRDGAVGFSIGNKGYIGTGNSVSIIATQDFWEYDQGLNAWTQKANFAGGGRRVAVGFSIGNKGYVGTGSDGGIVTRDFWEYDPSSDTWIQKADFGGIARYFATGFSIGSRGYIGTGSDLIANKQDFWEYNPVSDTWTQKSNFGGVARIVAASFSIGNKGYIGTGSDGAVYLQDFWEYNPVSDFWIQKASLGAGRFAAVGLSIDSRGYIGLGNIVGVTTSQDFWEYTSINNLNTNAINGSKFCAGDIINLSYTVTGTFGITNVFTAQLSDASGSFAAPVDIGIISSTTSGVVISTIPSNTTSGTGYRIRIVSTDPVLTGNDNGSNITIYALPNASAYSNSPICTGTTLDLYTSGGTNYFWSGPGGFSSPLQNPSITNVTSATAGTYNVTVSEIHNGDVWTPKAAWPGTSRFHAVGFSIGDKGYFGTGYDGSVIHNDFWEYNPVTNAWTQKAAFTGGVRSDATGFSIGNKGYIGLGANGSTYYNDFWEYNPAVNQWTLKAAFSGGARIRAVGFGIGTKGYIGTGEGANYLKDFWEYDQPTNVWVQKANFGGIPRGSGIGFSIGSKGYIGTGWGGSHNKDFWEYNPVTNSWVQKASFGGIGREFAAGFSIGDKGYIGTGADSYLQDFWEYNSQTNIWTQRADFGGGARYGAFGFAVGSRGYIGGGIYYSSILNDFWEYTPPENICSSSASTLVEINPSPTIIIVAQTDASCPNTADGTIDLNAVGGSAPFVFEIDGTSTLDGYFTNLTPGIYTAEVTDANGCIGTLSITINSVVPPLICSDAFVSTNICPEESFRITANFSGGIGPFSYAWNDHGVNGGTYGNAKTITANLPTGHYVYSCIITDACGQTCTSTVEFKICDPLSVNSITLNLKFFIQGYYIGNSLMTPALNNSAVAAGNTYPNMTDVDTVNVALHDPALPNALIDCATGIVDVNGNCSVYFPSTFIGQSYYISICNRNLLQTTTANPVTLGAVTNYNFTNGANKAYGGIMKDVGTPLGQSPIWAFYSGDVDHNCVINYDDYNILVNEWYSSYGYLLSDLNGDGYVDYSDFTTLYDNIQTNTISGINWCCECTNIVCVSLTNCPDTCSMDTLFINTGIDHYTNSVLDTLQRDRFWKLISTPAGTLLPPQDVWTIKPNPGWHSPLQNEHGSNWVGDVDTAGRGTAGGDYVYEFYFCLHDTAGLSLDLSFLADNTGIVRLNGTQILASINGPGGISGFSNPASTTVNGTFIPNSKNVLRVEVDNVGNASGFNIAGRIISSSGSIAFPGCCSDTTPPVVQCSPDVTIYDTDSTVSLIPPTVTANSWCLPVTLTNDTPAVFPLGITAVTWTATDVCGRVGTCVQNVLKRATVPVHVLPMTVCAGKLRPVSFSIEGFSGTTYYWTIIPGNFTGTIDANTGINTLALFGAGNYTIFMNDGPSSAYTNSVNFSITEIYCLDTCHMDTLFINTGIEHLINTTLALQQEDPFWKLVSTPSGVLSNPQDAWTITRDPGWHLPIQNEFGSRWMGDSPTANLTSPIGSFAYEFYFCLQDTAGISLDLSFLADNSGVVKLNGIQILSSINGNNGFNTPATTIVHGPFIPGSRNVLRVEINNQSTGAGFNIAGRIISSAGAVGFPGCCCADTIPPVINCGQDITICYSNSPVYFVTPTVSSDSCCLPVTITNNAPAIFTVGTTPVTWTATDACGRVGTCLQNVTMSPSLIFDVTPPVNLCIGTLGHVSFSIRGDVLESYSWSITPGNQSGTINGMTGMNTYPVFGAGSYTLTVSDGNAFGCSESVTFNIAEIYCVDTCNLDTLFINTGIEHIYNTTLGVPQQDRFWKVISTPSGILSIPENAWSIPLYAGWHSPLQNENGSVWIGNSSTAGTSTPRGDYVYEFYFCLHDTDGLSLDLSFLADNRGILKLNGTQILQTILTSSGDDGFKTPASIIVHGNFIPNSVNVIRVELFNEGGPSGFNIAEDYQ